MDLYNTKNMNLIAIGSANWDLYTNKKGNVFSIPKTGKKYAGCKPSFFGDKQHIRRLIQKGYFNDTFTNAGLEFMQGLHSRLYVDSKGNKFSLLRF